MYSAAEGHVLAQPWVLEVLQRAPLALRSLQLYAHWPAAVAETMAGLGQLRVLSLKGMCVPGQGAPAVQPLGDGPVWGHLRALQWSCKAALPEVSAPAPPLACPAAAPWRGGTGVMQQDAVCARLQVLECALLVPSCALRRRPCARPPGWSCCTTARGAR